MSRVKEHDQLIDFLKNNMDREGPVIPAQGVMITNCKKYCESHIELLENSQSELQYKLAVYHVHQFKKAIER